MGISEQPKRGINEADSGLVVVPNRAGMSFLANRVVAEQLAAGGTAATFDTGCSADVVAQAQHAMRVGRKRNDGPVIQPTAEPYYRQFDKR